jgi:hypothetical protein
VAPGSRKENASEQRSVSSDSIGTDRAPGGDTGLIGPVLDYVEQHMRLTGLVGMAAIGDLGLLAGPMGMPD